MKPFYEDQWTVIYNADCLEVLPYLESSSVHLCVTSPPFNKAGFEGFKRTLSKNEAWRKCRNIDYGEFDDFLPEDEYRAQQVAVLGEVHRLLKSGGACFYNHKIRVRDFVCSFPTEWLLQTPFNIRQEIVWDRDSGPSISPIRFMPSTERIYWLMKGDKPAFFNPASFKHKEVWRFPPSSNTEHPAPFPEELPLRCINACGQPRETVLDPYVGSGTTLRAAKKLGLKSIGVELSERWCEFAARSMSQEVMQFV